MKFSGLVFSLLFIGCAVETLKTEPVKEVQQVEETKVPVLLSWENDASRVPWSQKWISLIKADLSVYESAGDMKRVCPKIDSFIESEKIKAIGEFWVAVALHESGFKPSSQAVDVGTKGDKNSWSVGLYQLSVIDSVNRKGPNFTFDQLLTPLANIELAHLQMKAQIKNCGLMILPNGSKCRYWAVILDGNRYSKVKEILDRVKAKVPSCF